MNTKHSLKVEGLKASLLNKANGILYRRLGKLPRKILSTVHKALPLHALAGLVSSRRLRLPDFKIVGK
jgi:hypothetical protein